MTSSRPRSFVTGITAVGDGLLVSAVVLGVIALGGATLLLCAGILLFAAFSGPDSGYGPVSAAGWIEELSSFASFRLTASANLAVLLIVASVFAVVGARRRSGVAMWTGLACGALIAATLLLLAVGAAPQLEGMRDSALEAARAEAHPAPTVEPEPTPTGPPPLALSTVREEMRRMLRVTLSAVGDAPVDAEGSVLTVDGITLTASTCDEAGTRVSADIAFSPEDAGAGARVLDAWVAAGYSADRAIQEDIRYSLDLPIEIMRMRDTTTIDALVHVSIAGRCAFGK